MRPQLPKRVTRRDFSKWVRSAKSNTVLGIACTSTQCPLVNYLTILYPPGAAHITVCNKYIRVITNKGNRVYPTPRWVQRFIARLDDDTVNNVRSGALSYRVEAKRVRAALKSCL